MTDSVVRITLSSWETGDLQRSPGKKKKKQQHARRKRKTPEEEEEPAPEGHGMWRSAKSVGSTVVIIILIIFNLLNF